MTRQTMAAASRKLKAAKDMVEDLKKDANARDEAIKWIENGQWQDRLARKECANVCRDILEGFEEVCKGYRERLVGAMVAAGGEAVTEDNEAAVTRLDVSTE